MTDPATLTCKDVEELLPLIAEGLLEPDNDAEVFEHLADCACCQDNLHQHDMITLAVSHGRDLQPQTQRAEVIKFQLPRSVAAAAAALFICCGFFAAYSAGVFDQQSDSEATQNAVFKLDQPETQILEVLPPQPGDDVPMIIIQHNGRTMIIRQDQIDNGTSNEHLDAHVPVKVRY